MALLLFFVTICLHFGNTFASTNGCGGTATGTVDDFTITATINCTEESISIDMTYDNYDNNWFGFVFNDAMDGDSIVYTTGKLQDKSEKLYFYKIVGKSTSDVQYKAELNWNEISTNIQDNSIHIVYKQSLDLTQFNIDTSTIEMRYAHGTSLQLQYHGGNVAQETLILDLETGGATTKSDDLILEAVHGLLMWFAWAFFASFGIMISAHRWLVADVKIKGFWFRMHKYVQIFVVILCVIGFVIAIVFTEDAGTEHFSNPHMIIGLVVSILGFLQPFIAWIRPHAPGADEKKAFTRLLWEIIHKSFGYGAWILGCIACYLGLQLPVVSSWEWAMDLSYIHLFGWCGLLLIVYIILFIIGCVRKKQEDQIQSVGGQDEDEQLTQHQDDHNDDGI